MDISAAFRMELIEKLDKTIWSKYSSYKKVEQYVKLNQTLYAYFVVNACATVGLFLIDFYEKKFPKVQMLNDDIFDDELPF